MNLGAVENYASEILEQYKSGHAKEHGYRPALQKLLNTFTDVLAVNDPKRSLHGNPDFILLKKSHQNIILGYAETKDIDVELSKTENTEQLKRYSGYDNLFLTNNLEFRFYKNGEKYQTVKVGELSEGGIVFDKDQFTRLADELAGFLSRRPENIRSGSRLAEIMGAKARRIRANVSLYLSHQGEERNEELEKIFKLMKELLVHDLSVERFADMYAQTLVYGLFIARYGDKTKETFTREEARELIPPTNPFLREFFDHIAGPRFDTRLKYIVDELCEVFSVSDVESLVQKHLKLFEFSDEKDPIIHFYEDFLREYDPLERKRMGAYYTPIPIVRFIIKQVDQVLKSDFGLTKGLADTSKKPAIVSSQGTKVKVDLHRVQILDPAVGTATFLNEIIKEIRTTFEGQDGRWQSYVESDLLPRIYGFELMMAPYTIAHLKLGLTLQETGVKELRHRLGVYLTNTLEEGLRDQINLFSQYGLAEVVTNEAEEAAKIKSERPIMVIIGNPPYSGVSSNETKYANKLIEKYKFEPGGQQKLLERKHWLNDDYVKFIAFAEEMIEKNGTGIVGMITNHGYLDNPTFRGMRWQLAQTFDKIYVLDLHGNSKKKEVAPDGGMDENVFAAIQQGVAILVAIKTGQKKKNELARVYHAELYGKRQAKFDALSSEKPYWQEVTLDKQMLYFVNKNFEGRAEYEKGVKLSNLFRVYTTGVVTMGDGFIVSDNKQELQRRIERLLSGDYTEQALNKEFGLGKNYAKWILGNIGKIEFDQGKIIPLAYRPFDSRYTYFDSSLVWRTREKVMRSLSTNNLALNVCRQQKTGNEFAHILVSNCITESSYISGRTSEISSSLPLYLYDTNGNRSLNLRPEILRKLIGKLSNKYDPEDILDYIYAILHSRNYRQRYGEFLKTDYPRVPIPTGDQQFTKLALLGSKLRHLHLLQAPELEELSTTYPITGDDKIEKLIYKENRAWINSQQYFGNVPEIAWNVYIGGYQPAQKWLKDRKGRTLTNEDIEHYQKIIIALTETDRVMKEIDLVQRDAGSDLVS